MNEKEIYYVSNVRVNENEYNEALEKSLEYTKKETWEDGKLKTVSIKKPENRSSVLKPKDYYALGDIETKDYIKDVLINNKNLNAYEGYLLGTTLKYLGTRLGEKDTIIKDSKKASDYLNWLIEYQDEK